MDEFIVAYLVDVKKAINEVESYFIGYPMRYDVFEKDYLRRSAVERKNGNNGRSNKQDSKNTTRFSHS